MNAFIEQETLNRCARAQSAAVDANLAILAALLEAEATGQPPDPEQLRELADLANDKAQEAFRAMHAAGAVVPDLPPRRPTPLHLLSTPSTRGLLEALRTAQEWAEEVDAERGNVLPGDTPLLPGESRGTGWAETISNITETLRTEVEGPRGRE